MAFIEAGLWGMSVETAITAGSGMLSVSTSSSSSRSTVNAVGKRERILLTPLTPECSALRPPANQQPAEHKRREEPSPQISRSKPDFGGSGQRGSGVLRQRLPSIDRRYHTTVYQATRDIFAPFAYSQRFAANVLMATT